jgi:hypothetical protein
MIKATSSGSLCAVRIQYYTVLTDVACIRTILNFSKQIDTI